MFAPARLGNGALGQMDDCISGSPPGRADPLFYVQMQVEKGAICLTFQESKSTRLRTQMDKLFWLFSDRAKHAFALLQCPFRPLDFCICTVPCYPVALLFGRGFKMFPAKGKECCNCKRPSRHHVSLHIRSSSLSFNLHDWTRRKGEGPQRRLIRIRKAQLHLFRRRRHTSLAGKACLSLWRKLGHGRTSHSPELVFLAHTDKGGV